jgi:hypothetical protein
MLSIMHPNPEYLARLVGLSAAALVALAPLSASASPTQICRTAPLVTIPSSPIAPTAWQCDPSNSNTSYATAPIWLPDPNGGPGASSFVWQVNPSSTEDRARGLGDTYSPYATAIGFTDPASGPVIGYWLWQPLGNGNLAAPRCWRLAGDGIWVETQPGECPQQ